MSEVQPHTYIELPKADNQVFPVGQQNVQVDGIFAFSREVPPDIEVAVLRIATALLKEHQDKDVLEVKSESLGDYDVTYQDLNKIVNRVEVIDLLKPYVRTTQEGADDGRKRATTGLRQI